MKIIFSLPIVLSVFVIAVSYSSQKVIKKENEELYNKYRFYAWIRPDFSNNKIYLHLVTMNDFSNGGYFIELNHKNYGYFQTFFLGKIFGIVHIFPIFQRQDSAGVA